MQEKELGVSFTRKYKERDGPFSRSLEVALTSLHVQRQAYQGGTFVGNHVHKLLKVYYLRCDKDTLHTSSLF